jgi:hypothetical protein
MIPALDPALDALRKALEASPVVRFLRESRAAWTSEKSRSRPLRAEEIAGLEARGNTAENWDNVRAFGAAHGSGLHLVHRCRFEGDILFSLEGDAQRLTDSRFRNVRLGAAVVDDCRLVAGAWIEDGAFLRDLGELRGARGSRFTLGTFLQPGSETGARKVFLVDGLTVSDCAAMAALPAAGQDALARALEEALKGLDTDFAYVGAKCKLEHVPVIENCYFGPGATLRGAAWAQNSIFASTLHEPVHADAGAIAIDSVLDAGTVLRQGAQAHRSLLLEFSGAERGAQVSDSVLGPSTVAAKGEITASLVGPFVGFHHQSLLIGALWPEGRGNIAYGANVGSNHTGRKPDQELRPGEGVFFGLGCSVKFPANYEASPYSLLASGVVAPPQRVAFPFSLIAPSAAPEAAGLNELMPGWMWSENGYALARNAYKYADRNRARHHAVPALAPPEGSLLAGSFLGSDLFAPGVVAHVLKALEAFPRFEQIKTQGVYTGDEIEGLGANFLRGARLRKGRAAYLDYLSFALCRLALWNPSETLALSESARPLLKALKIPDGRDLDVGELFSRFLASAEASLAKDTARGREVFGDYDDFHGAPGDDAVCKRLRADLDRLLPRLRERLR